MQGALQISMATVFSDVLFSDVTDECDDGTRAVDRHPHCLQADRPVDSVDAERYTQKVDCGPY